jgi:aldose 1-epimerase
MRPRPEGPPLDPRSLPLVDSSAVRLAAGDLEALFLPRYGMLGASLRRHGVELLRRVEDLPAAAKSGSTAGIPLLHPFANRLAGLEYEAAGRRVRLDPRSPLLHFDSRGLPIHGVPWAKLPWDVAHAADADVEATLEWRAPDLLSVFPYPHALAFHASLSTEALTLALTMSAGEEGPVPVSFGFHPYLGIPGAPRTAWRLSVPSLRRLALDASGIPTGGEEAFGPQDEPLGGRSWDDAFATTGKTVTLAISGPDLTIAVDFLEGYGYAQVYAPADRELLALEPMTAPTSALTSGRGLNEVPPGGAYRAAFRIRITPA